jgi:hypothetical protein
MKIQTRKPKVRGSNPLLATKKIKELEENSDPLFILPKNAVPKSYTQLGSIHSGLVSLMPPPGRI